MREVTQDNFVNETWKEGIYAVEFYTPMCVHCRLNAQILENNEQRMLEQGITVLKCNAAENADLVKQLNIMSVPFMLMIQVKQEEVNVKAIEKFNTLQGKQMLDKIYETAKLFGE
jgi:thiol:disulfide interchange protein